MNASENDLRPLVSICIPVYNGEKYIKECINSALTQDFENFELLVIDNCSSDSTALIVNNIQDKRIRYIKNDNNIGSINNFNKCIELSNGNYFVLLPHDDLLLPNSIKKFVDVLVDSEIGLVYSTINIIDDMGQLLSTKSNHSQDKLFSCEEAVKDIIDYFVPIQLAMVRTKIIKKMAGFDSNYGLFCDVQLWLKVIFDGWKTFYFNTPLSCHRIHSEQGQIAFINSDITIIKKHWSSNLNQSFWKKNSYNNFLLNLIIFISRELNIKSFENKLINDLLLKMFVRSHLRSFFIILSGLKIKILWYEILLFKDIIKLHGFLKVSYYYLLVTSQESFKITQKLFKRVF